MRTGYLLQYFIRSSTLIFHNNNLFGLLFDRLNEFLCIAPHENEDDEVIRLISLDILCEFISFWQYNLPSSNINQSFQITTF